jgi:reactive intermediate/imine deaminase
MQKAIMDSAALARPVGPYSNGVKVRLADATFLFISGVVAFDSDGGVVGKGDLRAQTIQVMENLKAILESEGATFDDIVKITNYYIDIDQYPVIAEVRRQYFGSWMPASTGVEVKKLIHEDLLVEIEAIAVINQREVGA